MRVGVKEREREVELERDRVREKKRTSEGGVERGRGVGGKER